ncbi:MAG: hypothetical protein Q8P20_07865 [bacterium]|nr:hypothetical protein [bacterium]
MAKKRKRRGNVGIIIVLAVILGIVIFLGSNDLRQTIKPEPQKWCFPQYGSAQCSVSTGGYYVQANGKTAQGSPVSIQITSSSSNNLKGTNFKCPSNAQNCRFNLKVGDLSFSQTLDSNAIVFKKKPVSGSDIIGVISTGTEEFVSFSQSQLSTFGFTELKSGDEVEIGFYDLKNKPFGDCTGLFGEKDCKISDVDFGDPIQNLDTTIEVDIKFLEVQEAITNYKKNIVEFGCNYDEALNGISDIVYDNSDVIKSNTDTSRKTSNLCDDNSCQPPGVINWLAGFDCSSYILNGNDGIVTLDGQRYVCEQQVGGKLYSIGSLTTDSGTFSYPQTLKKTVTCCPGTIIGNKICKQQGNNFFLDDITEKDLECISDAQCPGSGIDYIPDGSKGNFYGCNLNSNTCEITKTINLECSPTKPCESGICSQNTGKCESIKEDDIKQQMEGKSDISLLIYIIMAIVLLIIILILLATSKPRSGNGATPTPSNRSSGGSGRIQTININ